MALWGRIAQDWATRHAGARPGSYLRYSLPRPTLDRSSSLPHPNAGSPNSFTLAQRHNAWSPPTWSQLPMPGVYSLTPLTTHRPRRSARSLYSPCVSPLSLSLSATSPLGEPGVGRAVV